MKYVWATVTAVSPLAIRIDTEVDPLVVPPESLVGGLQIGDRVWVQLYGRQAIVLGRAGGGDTGYITTGIGTIQTGWTLNYQRGQIRGGIAFVSIEFVRTGGTITVSATGDIANTLVFEVAPAWRPPVNVVGLLPGLTSSATGRVAAGTLGSVGNLNLVAVAPGANIVNTDALSLYGSWPVA